VNQAPRSYAAFVAPSHRKIFAGIAAALCIMLLAVAPVVARIWRMTSTLPIAQGPSRLYGLGFQLTTGQEVSAVTRGLAAAGYRELAPSSANLAGGFYQRSTRGLDVALRRFPTAPGLPGGGRLEILVSGDRVSELRLAGQPVPSAELEPPLLASYYGAQAEERWPVRLEDLPPGVVAAVLAAEDADFQHHGGISLRGTLRALWVDVRSRRARQGGSTITQQLAKILYLNSQRTIGRKLAEAMLAVTLELRYPKQTILEAYLNDVYWGRSGGRALRGIGAASRAFFGKDAESLTVSEGALLAGMICAPADYSPVEHPAAAQARRNAVLARLAAHASITPAVYRQALAAPLGVVATSAETQDRVPYFAAAAATEAQQRFGIRDLAGGGYLLFSTLDLRAQADAERAVTSGLEALEHNRPGRPRHLEAALVSVDPHDGGILAYVGGRDPRQSVYDRAGRAHRQLGSAFKPVVYAAAFAAGVALPSSLLDDSPVAVNTANGFWEPQNFDREFRGPVSARTALEQSLNVPTVRLAFQTGLSRVADLAQELGLERPPELVPALALGAIEVSPRAVAGMYGTFAAGGLESPMHALRGIVTPAGEWRQPSLAEPRRILPAQTAFEVTSILEGALDHGTGRSAWGQAVHGQLAGKTGTTSDGRDSWFAGYSPDRATVVWVGNDDDSPTGLTGSTGAAVLWGRFIHAVRPAGGFPTFRAPPGMRWVRLDPATGELATAACPATVEELLPEWQTPVTECHLHRTDGGSEPAAVVPVAADPNSTAAPSIAIELHPSPDGNGHS
jgi:penicillin-binding protein 1B